MPMILPCASTSRTIWRTAGSRRSLSGPQPPGTTRASSVEASTSRATTSGLACRQCFPVTSSRLLPMTTTWAPSSRNRITGTQNSRSSNPSATKTPTVTPLNRMVSLPSLTGEAHPRPCQERGLERRTISSVYASAVSTGMPSREQRVCQHVCSPPPITTDQRRNADQPTRHRLAFLMQRAHPARLAL